MEYVVNWDMSVGVFAVPDSVVDCIKLANGKAVKVILYLLGNKFRPEITQTADALGMGTEDIEDALSYWEQVGVIRRSDAAPKNAPPKNAAPEKISAAKPAAENPNKMLSAKEVAERANESKDIGFLFHTAQDMLARSLTYTEQRTMIWIYDYHGLGADLILMIIDFCKSINRTNINFIEKIASGWSEKNISTHEQAEQEIRALRNYYSLEGQIKSRLEINRGLTPKERDFIKGWANSGASADIIMYAYEKAADVTGKLSFAYMDKIMSGLSRMGIKTAAEAREYGRMYKPERESGKDGGEHSYNLDLLMEYARNNVPGVKEEADGGV